MVAAGEWRDYARNSPRLRRLRSFRRAAENPQARVEKRTALRTRQGSVDAFRRARSVLKRGHELAGVLAPMERRLVNVGGGLGFWGLRGSFPGDHPEPGNIAEVAAIEGNQRQS